MSDIAPSRGCWALQGVETDSPRFLCLVCDARTQAATWALVQIPLVSPSFPPALGASLFEPLALRCPLGGAK